ncbi:hypothetical protein AHOG_22690 [Actinoalloteichus hoggarensis]|uniref:Uncharacterized protein n=1 Tax=Actinoalloteichus hoggarensis TaxID=1470176 RepID=A0A221W908_9PSEU|nr:hypothetical protein AHOG_22690 [Actinoalloteichus hoggarensis]
MSKAAEEPAVDHLEIGRGQREQSQSVDLGTVRGRHQVGPPGTRGSLLHRSANAAPSRRGRDTPPARRVGGTCRRARRAGRSVGDGRGPRPSTEPRRTALRPNDRSAAACRAVAGPASADSASADSERGPVWRGPGGGGRGGPGADRLGARAHGAAGLSTGTVDRRRTRSDAVPSTIGGHPARRLALGRHAACRRQKAMAWARRRTSRPRFSRSAVSGVPGSVSSSVNIHRRISA